MSGASSNNYSSSPGLQHNLNHENASTNPPPAADDNTFISKYPKYASEFDQIQCLGKGGFGIVFKANKKFDNTDYAVKIITLPTKQKARDRMMREVFALAKLDHPNIVGYHDAWLESPPHGDELWLSAASLLQSTSASPEIEKKSSFATDVDTHLTTLDTVSEERQSLQDDSASIVFKSGSTASDNNFDLKDNQHSNLFEQGSLPMYLYIQMQLCRQESLKDWLSKNPGRRLSNSLNLFGQIVEAVEYIHSRKFIHRDLKPSNILFSLEGQIKVGDFGLVTYTNDYDDESNNLCTQESHTRAVGTDLYMSPEQLRGGQYDHKVDIYSLGIIFFELLVPFHTEMERSKVLKDLSKNIYPDFITSKFPERYALLNSMLSSNPESRPDAKEIKESYRRIFLRKGVLNLLQQSMTCIMRHVHKLSSDGP